MHHQAMERVILRWPSLVAYVTYMVSEETVPRKKKVNDDEVSTKDKKSEQRTLRDWYSIMLYSKTKAYYIFFF